MLSSKIVSSKLNFSNKRSYSATTSSLKDSLTNYSLFQVGQVQNTFANHNNGEVTVSKLSNGVTVISKNGNGVNTSFGLFVKAGSAYETPSTAGASSFLRRSALKSTANTSGLRVARFIQSLTGEFNVQNGRETIEYHVDFLRSDSENVGTFLSEILHPRLAEWEVRDTKDELTKELEEEKCLYSRIKNALYFQGYKGQGVGRPLSSPNNLDNIDQQILRNYASKFLQNAAGVSLVGVGIDHASLVTAAEAFSSLKADKNSLEVKSTYFGGEHFEEDLSLHSTSLVVAFPIAKEHSIPLRVISHVLGAGNIKKGRTDVGDGVNSRFGSLVLSNSNVSSAKAFVLDSANGGGNFPFFGVSGNTQFGSTAALQSALVSELSKLEGSLNDADISRAKNLAKLQFASQLEDKSSLKNLLYYNQVNPVDQFAKIDAVSLADVKSVLKNALNANPTVVCIGDLTGLSSVKL